MSEKFEVVLFDCFGGGSYRSQSHSRHLPKIGLVQIVNELASRSLCDPMLPAGDDSRQIIKGTRKRLAQAAETIRNQSDKRGILVIVDASDNSQVEADFRHEEAFPKLLLSSISEEPIEGVKLLLTARTHRRKYVIDKSKVVEVALGPFSDQEAHKFLRSRRPDASSVAIRTALKRSGRNARVLNYLLTTWDKNVLGSAAESQISVPEIIAQNCEDIINNLHVVGWTQEEVSEFFVALSLLPPPIPLDEIARALGWSTAHVTTAASDLAPMLEITAHGAIFRDEPTETYIRETYSVNPGAQREIADRLVDSQATSTYAAEALPHFLVVIDDGDRAFALADSTIFPSTVQSEFGRRRLVLERLSAAFRLAVKNDNVDKQLALCMRLAQATTANMRGDEYIRTSPALAVVLGDTDSYRRLFADRTGWRGARSARLTVANQFAGDTEEASVQCESTVRWLNWHVAQPRGDKQYHEPGPKEGDYAAILFKNALESDFAIIDRNLVRWQEGFARAVCRNLLWLLEAIGQATGNKTLAGLVAFASSANCKSVALRLELLSHPHCLDADQARAISRSLRAITPLDAAKLDGPTTGPNRDKNVDTSAAAFTALLKGPRIAASAIARRIPPPGISSYNYSERHGDSGVWPAIFQACVGVWAKGARVLFHHLLPEDVPRSKRAKAAADRTQLMTVLKELRAPIGSHLEKRPKSTKVGARFNESQCDDICNGIKLVCELVRPIEDAVLSRKGISASTVFKFLDVWSRHQTTGKQWSSESASDVLTRAVGLGCLHILLSHVADVPVDQGKKLIQLISTGRFFFPHKVKILGLLARHPSMHALVGEFAAHVAEQIRLDNDVDLRGSSYLKLATALLPTSIDEAREYYRQGLAQLDQMGGESYEQIYSLLQYASVQKGGVVRPELSQRLMNMCETLIRDEPRKFGWTPFGRAAANSIGVNAVAKLVRWHDQDVANLSYGLPQLACFLAEKGHIDARRAAFLLTICKEHGWWDWQSGDGVSILLRLATPEDQVRIFGVVVAKLRSEFPDTAWQALWKSYLAACNQFPNVASASEREAIGQSLADAVREKEETRARETYSSDRRIATVRRPSDSTVQRFIADLLAKCTPLTAEAIDKSLRAIQGDEKWPYTVRQDFLDQLRAGCPYQGRLNFLLVVAEAAELSLSQSIEIISESIAQWESATRHLAANADRIVEKLLASKSDDLFGEQVSNAARKIQQLSQLCSDKRLVLRLILRKVAAKEVALDGNEWLQLATALCEFSSGSAGREALEHLLAGPAFRIADEVGEGPFHSQLTVASDEACFFADMVWHLLGDDDSYVRWTVARSIKTMTELGLYSDIELLLDRFDIREVPGLSSKDRKLPFQNSRQWLLMGLARSTWFHGTKVQQIQPKLLSLVRRDDLHVIDKAHITRALQNIHRENAVSNDLEVITLEIDNPHHGVITCDDYPDHSASKLGFRFDYEFAKHDISSLAGLFNISQGQAEDAVATEIRRLWPDASSLDYFPGRERYRRESDDRYENCREHAQRHGLLSAATTLSKERPVVRRSYSDSRESPWLEWRRDYDTTFSDGTWLADRKDSVPPEARVNLFGRWNGRDESMLDIDVFLEKLSIVKLSANGMVPLYGRWSSPDGVHVSISTALTDVKGAIGRCSEFSKRTSHDLWLPEFWDSGYYDRNYRRESPFEPFVWAPESYHIGIDAGDEIAAQGPHQRPRLGIEITKGLKLTAPTDSNEWTTESGQLALRSQVWGRWEINPEDTRSRHHNDGEILWASPAWLQIVMPLLNRHLVHTVTLRKFKSARSHESSRKAASVIVALRSYPGTLRYWYAKRASKAPD